MKNFEHIKLAKLSLAGTKTDQTATFRGIPLHEFTAEEVNKIIALTKHDWWDTGLWDRDQGVSIGAGDHVVVNKSCLVPYLIGKTGVVVSKKNTYMFTVKITGENDTHKLCGTSLDKTDEPKHVRPDFPYKPGDRVQLVQADVEGFTTRCNIVNEHAGELATVVSYNGGKWYAVERDSNGKVLTVHLDHLASTTKLKPSFRVGDKVIVSGFSNMFNEAVGAVTEVKHHTNIPRYSVKLDTMNGTWGFGGQHLEPAPQTDNSFIRSEN